MANSDKGNIEVINGSIGDLIFRVETLTSDRDTIKICVRAANELTAINKHIDEQAATIDRLTADAKLNDMAWTDNQAALNKQAEENRALKGLLENSRIALTFYREWMFSHAETRYPFGHEIESEIALKLAGES